MKYAVRQSVVDSLIKEFEEKDEKIFYLVGAFNNDQDVLVLSKVKCMDAASVVGDIASVRSLLPLYIN